MGCTASRPLPEPPAPAVYPSHRPISKRLGLEVAKWEAADASCRRLSPEPVTKSVEAQRRQRSWRRAKPMPPPPPPRPRSALRTEKPRPRTVSFAEREPEVIYVPALADLGPRLQAEVYWTYAECQRFFRDRRMLDLRARRDARARASVDGFPKFIDVDPAAELLDSRRGTGTDPWEEAILGDKATRSRRVELAQHKISRYQAEKRASFESNASISGSLYEEVAAAALDEKLSCFELSRDSAAAAAALAQVEHEEFLASLEADERSLVTRTPPSPAAAAFAHHFATQWPPPPGSPSPLAAARRFASPSRAARRSSEAPTAAVGFRGSPSSSASPSTSTSRATSETDESLHETQMNWAFCDKLRADSLNDYDADAIDVAYVSRSLSADDGDGI